MKDEETHPQQEEPTASDLEGAGGGSGEPSESASLDFASIETPEELLPIVRPAGEEPAAPPTLPEPLDRERPNRRPIVPTAVWLTVLLVLLGAVIGLAAWMLASRAAQVSVPSVVGRPEGVAQTILAQSGLETDVTERRFSDRPEGQVLSQSPPAGTEVDEGSSVALVVSAGTEELLMPDVIGDGIALARGVLEAAGLAISIENVPSQAASDTVLATTPSPGVPVRSGDVVRVQVATPIGDGAVLQPYQMDGRVVVIDPAPVKSGQTDITLTTARRLQALLEASGAKVYLLRSGTSTATTDAARKAGASKIKGATVGVGLAVRDAGLAGRTVSGSNQGAPASVSQTALIGGMTNQLAVRVPPATQAGPNTDPVFGPAYPWLRVGLGSFDNAADKTAFSDPRWADRVAEAIYTGLGEVFGTKEQL